LPFDIYGFLGKQVENISQDTYEKHKELYDLIFEINKFAQKIKYEFVIHNQNIQELTIGSLYIKIIQSFESVIILSQRGLETDSKAILRVMLEAVFYLKSIYLDPDFVYDYIMGDEIERYRILFKVSKDNENIFSEELKEYVKKENPRKLKQKKEKDNSLEIYNVAKKAKMYDFYQLVYGTLSSDIHTPIRSLEKYYGIDENGNVSHLICVPIFTDLTAVILTACSILLVALDCLSMFFKLNYESKISNYNENLKHFDCKKDKKTKGE
jgi:hypothetical protein